MKHFIKVGLLAFVLTPVFAQNKATTYIDNMQKKFKAMGAFSANFSYSSDGGGTMSGSITVKGNKFRLKTSGQEIFNNGKEVATFIKEINEVNISNFDPSSFQPMLELKSITVNPKNLCLAKLMLNISS